VPETNATIRAATDRVRDGPRVRVEGRARPGNPLQSSEREEKRGTRGAVYFRTTSREEWWLDFMILGREHVALLQLLELIGKRAHLFL